MSQYTTGEIAKLCGVSVRTVQYYDGRKLLTPSAVSEGGRRLYAQDDVRRLQVICFLRSMGLSLGSIADILEADNCEKVITLLLDQQEQTLNEEVKQRQEQLAHNRRLRQEIRSFEAVSVEHLHDIAHVMENTKKLRKVHGTMLAVGVGVDLLEIGALLLWARTGQWILFAAGMAVAVAFVLLILRYYYRSVAYICPECHALFKPRYRQFFFAPHTPKTRKLTCTQCGSNSFCVETVDEQKA